MKTFALFPVHSFEICSREKMLLHVSLSKHDKKVSLKMPDLIFDIQEICIRGQIIIKNKESYLHKKLS